MNIVLNLLITISMLFIALTLWGYVLYRQLPVELLPNAGLPVLFLLVILDPCGRIRFRNLLVEHEI